ncbi:MAG TPA: RraA family protein, partial [Paraburkholderia sp.]|nr:RraA family protein [Paraburkholderia sp.]
MNPIGWREYESAPQVDSRTLTALRELAVSLLSDNMARSSGILGLQPFHQPKPMAG